jgi:hypothetical protein
LLFRADFNSIEEECVLLPLLCYFLETPALRGVKSSSLSEMVSVISTTSPRIVGKYSPRKRLRCLQAVCPWVPEIGIDVLSCFRGICHMLTPFCIQSTESLL